MRDRKGVDLDGREGGQNLGGVGGGESKIRILCMKKYIFNKRKLKKITETKQNMYFMKTYK